MNIKSYILLLSSILIINISFACGNKPLFDELAENRVQVIIKGTYESNNPRNWNSPIPEDDSVFVYPNATDDASPTIFMLDLAGLKVMSEVHHQFFANFRKTYSADLIDTDALFNGTGIVYKNNDMRPDFTWPDIEMFIRKMIFNNAKEYSPDGFNTWTYDKDVVVNFHEEDVNGLNFNLFQTNTYYDSLKSNASEINRIFPLIIPVEDGFIFDYNEKETVLEIRLVIKNFVKKYEYEYNDADNNRKLRHFYALSDWIRDIKRGEAAQGIMGGNLLAVARYYVPGKTATITGDAGLNNCYLVAIKANHQISEYNFSKPDRPADSGPNTCDSPKEPRSPLLPEAPSAADINSYTEALIDYYLQYELYKENYDLFVDCVDSGRYETEWNNYDTTIQAFKIPPFVTWVGASDTNFTLENVPVGVTYNIYRSDEIINPGALPTNFSTYIGTVTLTDTDIGNPVNVQ